MGLKGDVICQRERQPLFQGGQPFVLIGAAAGAVADGDKSNFYGVLHGV